MLICDEKSMFFWNRLKLILGLLLYGSFQGMRRKCTRSLWIFSSQKFNWICGKIPGTMCKMHQKVSKNFGLERDKGRSKEVWVVSTGEGAEHHSWFYKVHGDQASKIILSLQNCGLFFTFDHTKSKEEQREFCFLWFILEGLKTKMKMRGDNQNWRGKWGKI